jgi:hypothetical protein
MHVSCWLSNCLLLKHGSASCDLSSLTAADFLAALKRTFGQVLGVGYECVLLLDEGFTVTIMPEISSLLCL